MTITTPDEAFGRIPVSPEEIAASVSEGGAFASDALTGAFARDATAEGRAALLAVGEARGILLGHLTETLPLTTALTIVDGLRSLMVSLRPAADELKPPKSIFGSRKHITTYFEKWAALENKLSEALERAAKVLRDLETEPAALDDIKAQTYEGFARADRRLRFLRAADEGIARHFDTLQDERRDSVAERVLTPLRQEGATLLAAMAGAIDAYNATDEVRGAGDDLRPLIIAAGTAVVVAGQSAVGASLPLSKKTLNLERLVGEDSRPADAAGLRASIEAAISALDAARHRARSAIDLITNTQTPAAFVDAAVPRENGLTGSVAVEPQATDQAAPGIVPPGASNTAVGAHTKRPAPSATSARAARSFPFPFRRRLMLAVGLAVLFAATSFGILHFKRLQDERNAGTIIAPVHARSSAVARPNGTQPHGTRGVRSSTRPRGRVVRASHPLAKRRPTQSPAASR